MANNIKITRSKIGLTQLQLSRITGISRVYISQMETDKVSPSVYHALRIASALETKVEDIFFINDDIHV